MKKEVEFSLTDLDYVLSALGLMHYEGVTLDDIYYTLITSESGEQFDAGVEAVCRLKEIVNEAKT